jgi:hypothetical protein
VGAEKAVLRALMVSRMDLEYVSDSSIRGTLYRIAYPDDMATCFPSCDPSE